MPSKTRFSTTTEEGASTFSMGVLVWVHGTKKNEVVEWWRVIWRRNLMLISRYLFGRTYEPVEGSDSGYFCHMRGAFSFTRDRRVAIWPFLLSQGRAISAKKRRLNYNIVAQQMLPRFFAF